jgi:CBS domain-containing protein
MLTSEFADEYQDWLEGAPGGKPGPRWFDRTLADVQHAPMLEVSPDTDVATVVELMNAKRQTAVLVLEQGKLVGIFTERDVLARVLPRGLDPKKARVRELMTENPDVLHESAMLSAALRTLALASYHHLPVIDAHGRPRAVVSLHTVVRHLLDVFPREIMTAPPDGELFTRTKEGA